MLIVLALFILLIIFIVAIYFIKSVSRYKRIVDVSKEFEEYKNNKQSELLSLKSEKSILNILLSELKQKNLENKDENLQSLNLLKQELSSEKEKTDRYIEEIKEYKYQVAILETQLKEQNSAMQEKLELLKNSKSNLKIEFENIANKIFDDSSKKLNDRNQESLNSVLSPIKDQFKYFKQKVEDVYDKESIARGVLQNELKTLKELNYKMSTDARNLTNALKNSTKQQGIWGEMVLENVLEKSGLREGFEYCREKYTTDDKGKIFRPDVVVNLPHNRDIVIDAKTSLAAYNKYIATDDEANKKQQLKNHINSVKAHIKNLSNKNYEKLKDINSLDFIFMFLPIEGALILALDNDINLYDDAFKQKIILVSPTTLLVALKAVENTWRYIRQSQNITDIYTRAEELYKKFVGFVEDLEKVGKSIDDANRYYENTFSKLKSGRGNLIGQVEKLKKVSNIKPKKEINKKFVDHCD